METIHLEHAHFTVPQSARDYYDMRREDAQRSIDRLRDIQNQMKDIKDALDQITKSGNR